MANNKMHKIEKGGTRKRQNF